MSNTGRDRNGKKVVGDQGEDLAVEYLTGRGFSIVEKNYRRPWGELDIVAKKGGMIHFVEVKTIEKWGRGHFDPLESVHPKKLARMRRIVQTYLLDKKISEDTDYQLDVVSVVLDGEKSEIELIEDVFL